MQCNTGTAGGGAARSLARMTNDAGLVGTLTRAEAHLGDGVTAEAKEARERGNRAMVLWCDQLGAPRQIHVHARARLGETRLEAVRFERRYPTEQRANATSSLGRTHP